ncbi:Maf family protein [Herbiconiux sp. SYSU D00978]|uniref:Maf family protein n=1 Tax=Herbiconiux sp. SYSU D00978 TaxID=2812562 RepID=UPI001A97D038|nr:nucleoside triphosphate pyrophosphatase [Herbiconiux sp. SYSU D00978]
MRLYLASTSPARLATLTAAGVRPFALLSPGVDEPAHVASLGHSLGRPLTPEEVVLELGRAKAEAVVGMPVDGEPIDGFILGGDSAFELDGAVYGKPHEPSVALERWRAMRGRTGRLHSGHWLIDHRGGSVNGAAGGVDSADVSFGADLDDAELEAYVATGEPLQVAGAFTIDARGAAFITSVTGAPSAVVGLSVPLVRRVLRESFGVAWHELWD